MAIRCGFTDTWPFDVASLTHGHSHPLRVRSSWDRSPFVYPDFETGKLTIVPAFRHISKNLIIGNYNSQEAIDNDDGSLPNVRISCACPLRVPLHTHTLGVGIGRATFWYMANTG
jgi:hypothetical protein